MPVSRLLRADSHTSFGPGAIGRESREVHIVGFGASSYLGAMWDTGFHSLSFISVALGENPHRGSLYAALRKEANAFKFSAQHCRLSSANKASFRQALTMGRSGPRW